MLPLLPLIILIPFFSIIPLFVLDKEGMHIVQMIASVLVFLLAIALVLSSSFNITNAFSYNYITSLGVNLGFQVTNVSLVLVLMSSIVFLAASFVLPHFIKENERTYGILFALTQGAAIAMFLSSNLLLLYVFWEIAEFAMFFIILLFGSYNRKHAAMKFIIYSIVSSLLLLIGILVIYGSVQSFDIATIIEASAAIPQYVQMAVVALFVLSFMIKMPVFPLHSWLPEAHTEAPTTGSMILAGVLLKFGGYGLILLVMMIPLAQTYGTYLAILFIFSAIYAAFVAMRQSNIKRAIAYTSITEMGLVGLGVITGTISGMNGAVYLMLAHGIAVSLLFLVAGTLNESYGTLDIKSLTGVVRNFRALAYLFIFSAFAALGIPLTSGFVGDLLVFIGSYSAYGLLGLAPLLGILIMGAFFFWLVENVFMSGKEVEPVNEVPRVVYGTGIFLACCTVVLGAVPFVFVH